MSRQLPPGAFGVLAYHSGIMSAGVIVTALRRERIELALRWLGQFAVTRAANGHPANCVDETLVLALLDDLIAMVDPAVTVTTVRPTDHAAALARLAEFPDNIVVTMELFQAGVQVLGVFAVENAGPWAAWSVRARNHFLGELDAVFPVLVRREVAALCERYMPGQTGPAAVAAHKMPGLVGWGHGLPWRN